MESYDMIVNQPVVIDNVSIKTKIKNSRNYLVNLRPKTNLYIFLNYAC